MFKNRRSFLVQVIIGSFILFILLVYGYYSRSYYLAKPNVSSDGKVSNEQETSFLENLLLRKYIYLHSKYTATDPNIYRIVFILNKVVDDYYDKLSNVKKYLTKQQFKLLLVAIMQKESGFDCYAVSGKHAIGIMQILPSPNNLKYLNNFITILYTKELFDLELNIIAGAVLLDHDLQIAYNLLKSKSNPILPSRVIRKALNIYSNDSSGKYTLEVLDIMATLRGYLLLDGICKVVVISKE